MSLALVQSRALLGLQAPAVTVEVHLANVGVKRNTVQLAKPLLRRWHRSLSEQCWG